MRYSKKSQYTEVTNRVIYILMSPLSKDFFIAHTRKDLLKDVFKDHYYGQRYQTKTCFTELRKQDLHPCLFVLEELTCTKVEAYNYVLIWTKIFCDAGYNSLNQGTITSYIEKLSDKNLSLYTERLAKNILDNLNCGTCLTSNYGRQLCKLFKGELYEK